MKRKILVGTLSIDMIIALSLFVISFIAYLYLGNEWIRDVVNLILGTIIGALRVSMTHNEKDDDVIKLLETKKESEYDISIEPIKTKEEK